MTCQSLISDLSDVESPSVATARMHLLRRFSREALGLAVTAFFAIFGGFCTTDFLQQVINE